MASLHSRIVFGKEFTTKKEWRKAMYALVRRAKSWVMQYSDKGFPENPLKAREANKEALKILVARERLRQNGLKLKIDLSDGDAWRELDPCIHLLPQKISSKFRLGDFRRQVRKVARQPN